MKEFSVILADGYTKFALELPAPCTKLVVPVSGGLDSALLFYLINYISYEYRLNLDIKPVTFMRDDFSLTHAQDVVDHVYSSLNLESKKSTEILISEMDSNKQVLEGIIKIASYYPVHQVYLGLIQTQPEHALHVPTFTIPSDSKYFKFPFRNLNKADIVDLICKLNQPQLFKITHSCVYKIECGVCNRCNEKRWALQKNNIFLC